MVFSQITTSPGEVASISINVDYIDSPLKAFELATTDSNYALLLESAEINSKDNLKSLMLVDTAVVLECRGNTVTLIAQNENGQCANHFIKQKFEQLHASDVVITQQGMELTLTFSPPDLNVNEEQRLKQVNAFESLRLIINQFEHDESDPFAVFLGGCFAYDMLGNFEQLPDVPDGNNTCPDFVYYLAETMVVIDHQNGTSEIVGNVFSGETAYANCFSIGKRLEHIKNIFKQISPEIKDDGFSLLNGKLDYTVNISDETFKQTVLQLKNNIVQGDIFQVVPSRCFSLPCEDSLDAYRHLKRDNPSPYMFYLKHADYVLFGASPESALKYCAVSRQVEVYPIAGTRKRGFDGKGGINLDLDSRVELELRNDQKEVAEHLMLVDLARNDVARISDTGTRYVKELLKVDRYSYVMHLVSRVVGKLKPELDALHAYQACMNMGTLVGAPKIKAAQLIRQVEKQRRGSYGGAVGYLNGNGDMDSCIVIRSAFVQHNMAHIQAGAGVVYDSDPQGEADETVSKAQAVIRAVCASQALLKSK